MASPPDLPGSPALDVLLERAAGGQPRAVARLITLVENGDPASVRTVMRRLAPVSGRAHVVGLTGPPGAGKSTTTAALVGTARRAGLRVGVLAVDPSSPFTGGALLGDRVRMQHHAGDREVFIRSMATRGHLGGLSAATVQALRVFDLAGCDLTLVETVGVGQSEIDIAGACDTAIVLLAPGMGDGVQVAKAGILEIGDILVVNKADRDGAPALLRELRTMVGMARYTQPGRTPPGVPAQAGGTADDPSWRPPIVKTVASQGEGIDELWTKIGEHRTHAQATGGWDRRRLSRARTEVSALVHGVVRRRLLGTVDLVDSLSAQIRDGDLDPYSAADELLRRLVSG